MPRIEAAAAPPPAATTNRRRPAARRCTRRHAPPTRLPPGLSPSPPTPQLSNKDILKRLLPKVVDFHLEGVDPAVRARVVTGLHRALSFSIGVAHGKTELLVQVSRGVRAMPGWGGGWRARGCLRQRFGNSLLAYSTRPLLCPTLKPTACCARGSSRSAAAQPPPLISAAPDASRLRLLKRTAASPAPHLADHSAHRRRRRRPGRQRRGAGSRAGGHQDGGRRPGHRARLGGPRAALLPLPAQALHGADGGAPGARADGGGGEPAGRGKLPAERAVLPQLARP